jgi:hypothetical protein
VHSICVIVVVPVAVLHVRGIAKPAAGEGVHHEWHAIGALGCAVVVVIVVVVVVVVVAVAVAVATVPDAAVAVVGPVCVALLVSASTSCCCRFMADCCFFSSSTALTRSLMK